MEIEFLQFGSALEQEDYIFVQHLEPTKITAMTMVICQGIDTQMFKSDRHGILHLMNTNISS